MIQTKPPSCLTSTLRSFSLFLSLSFSLSLSLSLFFYLSLTFSLSSSVHSFWFLIPGVFAFSSLPCGSFALVPFYQTALTTFDVVPAELVVAVGHEAVVLPTPFQVSGFSATGRVVDRAGQGLAGVTVLLDGKERATSDAQGRYRIERVTAGAYTLTAAATHYSFQTIHQHSVSATAAAFPDVTSEKVSVCGRVEALELIAGRRVYLTGMRRLFLLLFTFFLLQISLFLSCLRTHS
jgi:hypothetical protein